MANNNKSQGFKAQVQSPPSCGPQHLSFKDQVQKTIIRWTTTTMFKNLKTKFKPTKRPHKLNLWNNLPFSQKISPFSILHKRPNKPQFPNTYPFIKRPHKPNFLTVTHLPKKKPTKTSPSLILYKRPCKAQNPKWSVIKLLDSSSRTDKTTILQRSQASKIQDLKSRS
jgi:hypothetical protein